MEKDKYLSKGKLRDKAVHYITKAEKYLEMLGGSGDMREQLRFMGRSLESDYHEYKKDIKELVL